MSASTENQNNIGANEISNSLGKMDLNGEASGEQGDVTEPSNLIPLEQLYRLCMKYYKGKFEVEFHSSFNAK